MTSEYLTVYEAAKELEVRADQLMELIHAGKVLVEKHPPGYPYTGTYYLRREMVERFAAMDLD